MKCVRPLIATIAISLAVAAVSSSRAQAPNVIAYFQDCESLTKCECKGNGVLDTLTVVANNLDMWLSTIEFAFDFGGNRLAYLGDVHFDNALHLGSSYVDGPGGLPDGVTITYPTPLNAFTPVVVMRIAVLWLCDDCDESVYPQAITAVSHEGTGAIHAVRWPDYHVVYMFGGTSIVCDTSWVKSEETTWGKIKALYR